MKQSFLALAEALDELDRAFDHLSWAIAQARPEPDGRESQTPAGSLDDYVQELRGWATEARRSLGPLDRPAAAPAAYRALVACQRFAVLLAERFNSGPASADAQTALGILARDGGDWQAWAFGVRDAIERCRPPLHELNGALLQCWQELVEQSELPNLTVSARRSPDEWPAGAEWPAPELIRTEPGPPDS